MLNNWPKYALREIFDNCVRPNLGMMDRLKEWAWDEEGYPLIKKAAHSYNARTSQVFELREHFSDDQMMVIDYDDFVSNKDVRLPQIYKFIDLPYHAEYAEQIHQKSKNKKNQFSAEDAALVEKICMPVYQKAKMLVKELA